MNIIVSYQNDWDENGTHYNQRIRVPKELKEAINNEMRQAQETRQHEALNNSHDYIYLNELTDNDNYTTLTTARLVKHVLETNGIDTKRVKLDRNTIISFF